MPRKKKLKVGDIVRAFFLGSPYECEVIKIVEKNSYKLRQIDGTILPGVKWKKDMDKKSVWFIDSYVGSTDVGKLTEDKITRKHTTDKTELNEAIEKQKKFIKGTISK